MLFRSVKLDNISRNHTQVSKGEKGYLVEDLNSRNGTYVNEQRIDKPRQLKDGDMIALGPDLELRVVIPVVQKGEATLFNAKIAKESSKGDATAFGLQTPSAADQTMAYVEIPPAPVVPPRLVVNESGKEPKIITITAERVRIGRQDDNDIVLDNRYKIGRAHV